MPDALEAPLGRNRRSQKKKGRRKRDIDGNLITKGIK